MRVTLIPGVLFILFPVIHAQDNSGESGIVEIMEPREVQGVTGDVDSTGGPVVRIIEPPVREPDRAADTATHDLDTVSHGAMTDTETQQNETSGAHKRHRHENRRTVDIKSETSIFVLREEIRRLHEEAEELREMAESLEDDADDLEDAAEDLQNEMEGTEEEIDETAETVSEYVEWKFRSNEGDSSVEDEFVKEQRELVHKHHDIVSAMRESSDSLMTKVREINVKVRELEEAADQRETRAMEAFDRIEELDRRWFTERFPLTVGTQANVTTVPPFDDKKSHILFLYGIRVGYFFRPYLEAGVDDIHVVRSTAVEGTWVALGASPYVSGTFFPLKYLQVTGSVGLGLQGHVKKDRSNDIALVPFVQVGGSGWFSHRFSMGLRARFSYAAYDNVFTIALPDERAGVLPQGAAWFSLGVTFDFHGAPKRSDSDE